MGLKPGEKKDNTVQNVLNLTNILLLNFSLHSYKLFRRPTYNLDIEDLQEVSILQKRKNLGKGELTSIAFAKKTHQAFLTDERKARKLAVEVIPPKLVQTTPHLLGWLVFISFLSDTDLEPIINDHKKYKRPLAQYFTEMYCTALDYRSKTYLNIEKENDTK